VRVPAVTGFIAGNPFARIRAVDPNYESAPFGGSIRVQGIIGRRSFPGAAERQAKGLHHRPRRKRDSLRYPFTKPKVDIRVAGDFDGRDVRSDNRLIGAHIKVAKTRSLQHEV
jgi:hypothetical protein